MRRCTNCFRYSLGHPSFCTHCGRTYSVRLCPRGHANPRGTHYCAECGSDDLSTAAPPEDFLSWASHWIVRIFVGLFVVLVVLVSILGVVRAIDWELFVGPLVQLALMIGILYWTTTLLPGPVKKVGRSAGKRAWKMLRGGRNHGGH